MGLSVLDVIDAGKWQRALFTTYALSLSFFESILLRSLRRVGCQETWVITDVQGYRGSLIERRSQGVGQEFRLVPVSLKEGVFHPKCIYLAGEQSDVLLVGSGNLTFGGFGKNLEVIEVLLSTTAPSAFGDFAGFLTSIENRAGKDLHCPDLAWIKIFRDCASRSSQPLPQSPQEQPRLIHTVDAPVISQLPAQINHLTPRELIVMSPFFDNDGNAVRKLADALGCTSVRIAVRPKEHKSNFPFKEALKWKQSIAAAWLDAGALKRPLHAKWIETRGEAGTAVLTGSINATTAAMCTTRNVEVGVLRTSAVDREWVSWVASTIPKHFEPAKYESLSLDELLVYAYLAGDGDLSGTILGAQIPSGLWKGNLIKPSGETKPFEMQVRSDGRFRATLPQAAEFSLTSGLQVTLRHGSTIARGWVHVEDILRMPRLPRLNIPAMLRLISREDTEDDEIALLEYLAVNATKHLATFSRRITQAVHPSSGHTSGEQPGTVHVALADLAPTPTPLFTPGSGHSMSQVELFTLDRVFARLRKRLLGHGEDDQASKPQAIGKHRGVEVENGEPDPPEDVKRFEDALFVFAHQMRTLVDSTDVDPKDVRGLYVIWFEVEMNMLVARRGDVGEAKQFMREWSAKVGNSMKAGADVDALEQHFITCAATVSVHGDGKDVNTVMHEFLENYYDGEVDIERAQSALLPAIGVPFWILLSQIGDPNRALTDSLTAVIASKTLRQHVAQVVEDVRSGTPIDASVPIFQGETGNLVLRQLSSTLRAPRFKEQMDGRFFCANCFTMYPAVMERQLEDHRIALCSSCGWFTIRTKR